MLKRIRRAALAAAAFLLVAAGTAGAANFTPGSAGLGDPYFPLAGTRGFAVSHYGLTLDYDQASNQLAGTAVITAQATQDLSRFDLDLRGFAISRLLVNGAAASFARSGQELVITPAAGIPSGSSFTVIVDYAG